ncbi:zinc-ribbon domain-containing protein, partial [Escherichia coli]|uniref:zinc-ribbon domain-containing protein n=1 Tax=Escherichia coli TaxID=562 RepID=UPI001FCD33F7
VVVRISPFIRWPNLVCHYMLEWHCVMCGQHFPGKKFCEACGTGIYSRAVCTKYVYSYQPDLFQDCGGAST